MTPASVASFEEWWVAYIASLPTKGNVTKLPSYEQLAHAAFLAAYAAATERAALIALTFIPDPHEEHDVCKDCWVAGGIAAQILGTG